jgi:hypothetical protein
LVELDPKESGIRFFKCPTCHRQYARKPGQGLTFRWLHPISLALYSVIFDEQPTKTWAEKVRISVNEPPAAAGEQPSRSGDEPAVPAVEELELWMNEIRLELRYPTQRVRDILGCRATEEELREYLRLYADDLERTIVARRERARRGEGG